MVETGERKVGTAAWRRDEVGWATWQLLLGLAEAGVLHHDGFATVMTWGEREARMWPVGTRSGVTARDLTTTGLHGAVAA